MNKKNVILFGVGGLVLVASGVVAYIKRKAIKEASEEIYQRVKDKLCILNKLPKEVEEQD